MTQGLRPWTWKKFHRELRRSSAAGERFARAVSLVGRCTAEELEQAKAMLAELVRMREQIESALSVVALSSTPPSALSRAVETLQVKTLRYALELRRTLDPDARRMLIQPIP
ncbi:MAG: hypothetical protein IPM35_18295 [Myxococcales bacterium]|nr:hypothetical protein [Myxococcales bacterium]